MKGQPWIDVDFIWAYASDARRDNAKKKTFENENNSPFYRFTPPRTTFTFYLLAIYILFIGVPQEHKKVTGHHIIIM